MNDFFLIHNLHLKGIEVFELEDPQLKKLNDLTYVHCPSEIEEFLKLGPGIYTLSGGRQIGKSTLLKQWLLGLLKSGKNAKNIFYFSGELISNHKELVRLIKDFMDNHDDTMLVYLIIDEVTYIKSWEQGVKFLADTGILNNVVLMLSGSDSTIIKEARNLLPGRRGDSIKTDFHYYPLNFAEFTRLVRGKRTNDKLEDLFSDYLLHGGFLLAINSFAKENCIKQSVFNIYNQWIIGDLEKRGKQSSYLKEVIRGIIKRYGSQVTWNSLAKDLSIEHPATLADYLDLLGKMDVTLVLSAIIEDKLVAAPKKAKKIYFKDPFINHCLCAWINESEQAFELARLNLTDNEFLSSLVEGVVSSTIARKYPEKTYYIKSEGEVDIAYVENNKFWPIEVKWKKQIKAKDLKQIKKYKSGRIWGKHANVTTTPPVEDLVEVLSNICLPSTE